MKETTRPACPWRCPEWLRLVISALVALLTSLTAQACATL